MTPSLILIGPGTWEELNNKATAFCCSQVRCVTALMSLSELLNSINPLMPEVVTDLSQGPSPDEMVIQARGRREVPVTFSPDVHLTPLRRQRFLTQPKSSQQGNGGGMNRLLLPTRTSPRKRLTLLDQESSGANVSSSSASVMQTPSPDKSMVTSKQQHRHSPISKKQRVQQNSSSPPLALARGLSHSQLVELLGQLVADDPATEARMAKLLPAPDLSPLEERLDYLKRNVYKALPSTRLESRTDSLAYNRVSTHLLALKKAVVDASKQLLDAQQWAAVVDHTLMAWGYVKATPVWDNPPHNNVRRQCFKALAASCMQALKKGHWNPEVAISIKDR